MGEIRVSVATKMAQVFILDLPGERVEGNSVPGQAALKKEGRFVSLVMSKECAAAKMPPYDLVKHMADAFSITDPTHIPLLHMALSSMSVESIFSTFTQHGISVKGLDLGMCYISASSWCRRR